MLFRGRGDATYIVILSGSSASSGDRLRERDWSDHRSLLAAKITGATARRTKCLPHVPTGFALRSLKRVPTECGDLPFLIRRDGSWLYRGTPINRKELVCLFASVLRREEDGSWWLQTPAERGRIEVEDAPFVAVELDWTGDGRHQVLSFRTNIDEVVTAGPDHPIRVSHDLFTCEPTPYILLRPGAAEHFAIEARINRATYYELVALAVPEWVGNKRLLGVWSCGQFFSLGEVPPNEA